MANEARTERIRADLAALEAVRAHSSLFSYQVRSEPTERISLTFHGAGLARAADPSAKPELVREHQVEIRFPASYPAMPPEIRWLSPILHPNISFSGFVNLGDVGLLWDAGMGLDIVCERLWDMARLAAFNLDKAVSHSAKQWLVAPHALPVPVDIRPLRDRAAGANRNVVKYLRKGQPAPAPNDGEVLFIDDDTPAPPLPPAQAGNSMNNPMQKSNDVLYIE